ncbi:SGNH/GDSL hydrolase family protein [Actinobacteria bacterium YIM 96077]|uniref:SGNH hydrolase-type esterase domain-containing protein n=1 Tax=Phytoactinopolyspora halophila TaxID=1981511 RepID=A0A329QAN8_9ACTN|nr:GDSL-type esterase/lipase family protein [Phytoactinopolyspora halophila]AYY13954.1 SGNH/GDSL hydrolase family protein [Actinobacteria bacterium YIM 96077]RAW09393.1 hypothetical protein DPM12_21315 [Phytoactinopolyspora halophila]
MDRITGSARYARNIGVPLVGASLLAISAGSAASAEESEDPSRSAGEPGQVEGDRQPAAPADEFASALGDPDVLVGAEFETGPPDSSAAIVGGDPIGGFPREGDEFVMLSTGDASMAYDPNDSGNTSSDFGATDRGVNDPTVLRIDLDVPETANCLLGVDFRFLSEEFPEFVGTSFNDAFVAEVGETTWSVGDQDVEAPRNFAFDEEGNPITINAAGAATMTEEEAGGTTYDGGTTLLTAATPLEPGPESLYFSIFDVGDGIFDSTILIDNIRVGEVADVEEDCEPGAEEVDPQAYVSLGDSYSSGFGVDPYHDGTHEEDGNDCQRSTRAYSEVLASSLDLNNSFHACQGAVTDDFYSVAEGREHWGEEPQLDYLADDTGLVTFSIGGNDAGFGTVLQDCIDGWELLPFNTCHGDERVTERVREAFDNLAGRSDSKADIHPYAEILADVRERSPFADLVAVGYPRFYPAGGEGRYLPGARCEAVKQADQRWIVEKIGEINRILETEAERFGYRFANPSDRFIGHELCGETGDEWIFPLLSSGRIHPTADGHQAMAAEVEEVLTDEDDPSFVVEPGETVTTAYVVEEGTVRTTVVLRWPGSDVVTTLRSPSGEEYSREDLEGLADHSNGPAYEHFELVDPEPGEWTIESHGSDVDPGGEPVYLSTYNEDAPNERPEAAATALRAGDTVELDGTGSSDPDGSIASHQWYVEFADADEVVDAATGQVDVSSTEPVSVTLVVTDDEGLTDFATSTLVAGKVLLEEGQTELGTDVEFALLAAEIFDAEAAIDENTLRLGPAQVEPDTVDVRDVNDDGYDDVVVTARYDDLGFAGDEVELCATGVLNDERERKFRACDAVSLPGEDPEPTPEPTEDPDDELPDTGAGIAIYVWLAAIVVGMAGFLLASGSCGAQRSAHTSGRHG